MVWCVQLIAISSNAWSDTPYRIGSARRLGILPKAKSITDGVWFATSLVGCEYCPILCSCFFDSLFDPFLSSLALFLFACIGCLLAFLCALCLSFMIAKILGSNQWLGLLFFLWFWGRHLSGLEYDRLDRGGQGVHWSCLWYCLLMCSHLFLDLRCEIKPVFLGYVETYVSLWWLNDLMCAVDSHFQ